MSDFNDNFKNSVTISIKILSEQPPHHNRAVHSQTAANVIHMATALNPVSCALAYRARHKWTLTSTSLLDYLGGGGNLSLTKLANLAYYGQLTFLQAHSLQISAAPPHWFRPMQQHTDNGELTA